MYPTHLHIHFVQKQLIDGCGWYAVHWTFEKFDLVVTFVAGVAKPVIVIGDFNITPEEFMATTMSTVMQVSNC